MCVSKLLGLNHLQSFSWLNHNARPNGLRKSLGRTKSNSSAACKLTQGEDGHRDTVTGDVDGNSDIYTSN